MLFAIIDCRSISGVYSTFSKAPVDEFASDLETLTGTFANKDFIVVSFISPSLLIDAFITFVTSFGLYVFDNSVYRFNAFSFSEVAPKLSKILVANSNLFSSAAFSAKSLTIAPALSFLAPDIPDLPSYFSLPNAFSAFNLLTSLCIPNSF